MLSPALVMVWIAYAIAVIQAKDKAAIPPSISAILFSRTEFVGLPILE